MAELITTLGPIAEEQLETILPHEHVFVDLRTWDQPGYAEADVEDVVRLMAPYLEEARAAGVSAIVEPSTGGVGRRADILRAVSEATGFPLVVPTGVYRAPWIPPWIHEASEDALAEWMAGELAGEIEGSGVRAGWIKLSAGDDGMTETERKVLRAGGRAGAAASAAIGSHTIRGWVVREQLDVLEGTGFAPERFVWIHTQAEAEFDLHLEMARRGAWVEYDGIGDPAEDDRYLELVTRMLDAGLGERVLLSHDRGWYDPAQPGGGEPRGYTYLSERFLPQLRATGADDETIRLLMHTNPFRAFAR
jgi:phosphotriesterase-related protein